jgi:tetratricopeptide (TPR) repeat protein
VPDSATSGLLDCAEAHLALLSSDLERALQCAQRARDVTDDFEVQAASMLFMGWTLDGAGNPDEAMRWYDKLLDLADSCGESIWRSYALTSAGLGRWRQEPARAEQSLRESLQISRLLNDRRFGAQCLETLAYIAGRADDWRRAVVLLAATDTLSNALGAVRIPLASLEDFREECTSSGRELLGPSEFEKAWAEGSMLAFDEAVDFAFSGR